MRGSTRHTFVHAIVSNFLSGFLTLSHTLNGPSIGNLFRFVFNFPEFIGRLQPSKATIQKTRGTLRVEESSSPRKVLRFYNGNSSRRRMRAELRQRKRRWETWIRYGLLVWVERVRGNTPLQGMARRDIVSFRQAGSTSRSLLV